MNIERNFKKNPHTARFLMAFHTAGGTRTGGAVAVADENQAEIDLAAQEIANYEHDLRFPNGDPEDLLNLVPDAPADLRSTAQAKFMDSLIADITRMDAELGAKTREWTDKATAAGHWTPGRTGNASEWIDKMIARRDLLKTTVKAPAPTTTPAVEIPGGRYAVETDEIRCYTVDYGKPGTRWEGFTFLNRISSDDRFPIKNPNEKARILATIAADVNAAALLAALTLRICRGTMKNGQPCGRTLSDTKNPYFSQGYGPECGKNL